MRVLCISLDASILDKNSLPAKRVIKFGQILDDYYLLVPGLGSEVKLTDKIRVLPSGTSNKVLSIFYIYYILKRLLKTGNYQLLTIQDNYFLAVLGVYLAKKYRVKVEVQNHGFEKLTWWRFHLARWAFQRADLIRTVSIRLLTTLQTKFAIDPSKIYVVPVPIEIKRLQSVPSQLDLHEKYPGKFIFLTVGRLVPIKNIALQLKALAALQNPDLILLIAGEGPERDNLANLSETLKIDQQVVFLGWLEKLTDYYRTSDCLMLTSFSEGFPLVASEAIVYDLPIIMTDVGSAGSLVKNNINGLIVPVANQAALQTAMRSIVADAELRFKLKQGSQQSLGQILESEQVIAIIRQRWQELIYSKTKR